MENRGTVLTPIFQFAQNNGLDEKEFFDFIKSKWGEEGTKGLTLESDVPHGTLEKFFDDYADDKFEKKYKEREPEMIKEFAEKGLTLTPKTDKLDHEIVNDFAIDAIKDNFTPPGAKSQKEDVKEDIDTNDNGKIEEDELDAYTKDLEDYLEKNPKAKDKNYY